MNAAAKIGLIGGGLVLASITGFYIYRNMRRNTPDEITFKIVKIDGKSVDYEYFFNGKKEGLGVAIWQPWKVKASAIENIDWGKNKISVTYLPNGVIFSSKSLGGSSNGKIVDFRTKTIKDYKGDPEETLKQALQTVNNLI